MIKIKNYEVDKLIGFLLEFELGGKESRFRTRFAKLLMKQSQQIKEEHQELLKQFADFKEDGSPVVVVGDDGIEKYRITDRLGFNKEYFELMNEDFIVVLTEENKEMLMMVKAIILECEMTFKGDKALEYDRWCEVFEAI